MTRFGRLAAALVGLSIILVPTQAMASIDANTSGNAVAVSARHGYELELSSRIVDPAAALVRYERAELCDVSGTNLTGAVGGTMCQNGDGTVVHPSCAPGDSLLLWLFASTRASTTDPWGPWQLLAYASCMSQVVGLSAEEFKKLPLAPSTLNVQPATTDVLVNKPTIVFTADAPQRLTATILGTPLEIEATPSAFTWDFSDGKPITTTSPGHPYPHQDVTHTWSTAGTWTITLTTTWTGRYRITGTQDWHQVAGTATTTSVSAPITSVERRAHLVSKDCIQDPDEPGCD